MVKKFDHIGWLILTILPIFCWSQEGTDRKIVGVISSTQNTEFSPTISADGKTMIFESDADKKKGWELFESRLDAQGNWSKPVPLDAINDKCQFLAGPSISYDGNTLYYTAFIEGVTKSEDLYYSVRTGTDSWSEPKSVGAPINTDDGYEGFPSISADGNSLYFIRVNDDYPYDKKSKENCFKIFVSQRNDNGQWSEPEALPNPINTGCERDPRIMADNHTLIFSSIREGGKGKYDLYQSRKKSNGEWTEPVALEFINAEDNDQSPCISAEGNRMYFYSLKDIYSVTIPVEYRQMINVTVTGSIHTDQGTPLQASITITDLESQEVFNQTSNPSDGRYAIVLTAGKKYNLVYAAANHLNDVQQMDLTQQDRYQEFKKDVTLRSEYTLNITVSDKDLNTPLSSFLTVKGVQTIFKDSVPSAGYPKSFTLKAGQDYLLQAAAVGYPPVEIPLKFDANTFTPTMNQTLNLVHEKVKYTADVTNVVTREKTKLKVSFKNQTVDEVIVANAGEDVYLRKGDRYQVMTSSDKGLLYSTTSLLAGEGEPGPDGKYIVNLSVVPIEEGAQLTMNYIGFDYNSATLQSMSYAELDIVIDMLQKNPTISIEIAAHTDDVGGDDYNLKLSQKRAQSVVQYLSAKGMSSDRLKPVGYGKNKPTVPNDSEENRAKNRRVELRILKVS